MFLCTGSGAEVPWSGEFMIVCRAARSRFGDRKSKEAISKIFEIRRNYLAMVNFCFELENLMWGKLPDHCYMSKHRFWTPPNFLHRSGRYFKTFCATSQIIHHEGGASGKFEKWPRTFIWACNHSHNSIFI